MEISRERRVIQKFHENRLRIDWETGEIHALTINLTAGICNIRRHEPQKYLSERNSFKGTTFDFRIYIWAIKAFFLSARLDGITLKTTDAAINVIA